jgi:copper chaperone
MKSIIKICNMESHRDSNLIQETVANKSGIIASEISLLKKEVVIIYNEAFLSIQEVIDSIEDLGYVVIESKL